MTILVAYAPRPEGQAALDAGIELARSRHERLIIVNAGVGGHHSDASLADAFDVERVETQLRQTGLDAEFKQFVRGNDPVTEIENLVERLQISLVVIGLRRRSPVGKLVLGSVAQDILRSVPCPVLAVKAP